MTITESLLKEIELGREGGLHGYSLGLPKLEGVVDGLTRGTLILVVVRLHLYSIHMFIVL